MKPKVLVARALFPEVIERLARQFDVESNQEDCVFSADDLTEKMRGKHALLTTASERISAQMIAASPYLKAICNMAVGYNNIDLDAATRAGIMVTNTPDVLTKPRPILHGHC